MLEEVIRGVRTLTADELGIGIKAKAAVGHTSSAPDAPDVAEDDPRVQEIMRLARRFGGVLLSGPPGTSKSLYAAAAAGYLSGDLKSRCKFVQFHASYQYEDFVLGFSPEADGFGIKKGPFLSLALDAHRNPDHTYVLVIDELSRADVGRVFGEALTYIEWNKREIPFTIASGLDIVVPTNLVIIATMNPFDRGVDEVDAAFERRFAKITMDPSAELLETILLDNEMDEALAAGVLRWFRRINEHARKNPAAAVGHAYFAGASDPASLTDVWEYQLKYLVQRAFRRDPSTQADVEAAWKRVFAVVPPEGERSEEGVGERLPDDESR